MNHKHNFKTKAFTLIELLVVVAIIGILATVVIVNVSSAQSKAKDAKVKSDLSTVQTAASLYYNDYNNYTALKCNLAAGSLCTALSGIDQNISTIVGVARDIVATNSVGLTIASSDGTNYQAFTTLPSDQTKSVTVSNVNSVNTSDIPTLGEILYWPFDEGQGIKAYDWSGNNQTSTSSNKLSYLGPSNCKSGACASLGTGGFASNVNLSDPSSNLPIDSVNNISISFWFYPTAFTSNPFSNILVKGIAVNNATFDFYFYGTSSLIGADAKKMIVYADTATGGGTNGWKAVSPGYTFSDSQLSGWHNIVWTYSGTAGGLLYVDGVSAGSAVGTNGGALALNNSDFSMQQGWTDAPFNIDELRVYNRVLSPSEVNAINNH